MTERIEELQPRGLRGIILSWLERATVKTKTPCTQTCVVAVAAQVVKINVESKPVRGSRESTNLAF